MTDILLDVLIVVFLIVFVVYTFFEIKNNKKRAEKYIEENNIRIEWFKNNMDLTSELKKKGENDNVHLDL